MPKKLTYEFVKKSFEKEGYTLLSKEYVSARMKLKYICPKGHISEIDWSNWNSGRRCNVCFGNNKPSYNFVKKSFEDDGYTLLSNEYINNYTKLNYICQNGHTHSITWAGWKRGQRCPYCDGQTKPTIEFIKKSFESVGYTLLSKNYTNNRTKLKYKCPKGHYHSMGWSSWQRGQRCYYCSSQVKPTIEFVRKSFEAEGYILLSNVYINNYTKLNFICDKGHKHSISWASWKRGSRCRLCSNEQVAINYLGPGHPNWLGGISFEPYCEIWKDKEYKSDIMLRDGNRCLNPYCYRKDEPLAVHHIDYNKKNCKPNNLITICRSCNIRANKDRDWHKYWYQAIMSRRYSFKY